MVVPVLGGEIVDLGDRVMGAPVGTKPIRGRQEIRLENGFEHQFQASLNHPVSDNRNTELTCWPSFLSPMIGAVDVSPVADDGLILWVLSAVVVGFVTVPGSGESCRRT